MGAAAAGSQGTLACPVPGSAAGPDLRQLVLGSEGRLGILNDVILRTTPLPEVDLLEAWALPGWAAAHEAVRAIAGRGACRRRPVDARRDAHAAGVCRRPDEMDRARAYLRAGASLLTGRWRCSVPPVASAWPRGARRAVSILPRSARPGSRPGRDLVEDPLRSPYLRNALWSAGYGSDTLETATDWTHVPALLAGLERRWRGHWRRAVSESTCSRTCRTCTRRDRACT